MKNYSKSDYSKKLLDPRWQRLRLEVLNKADFTCEICMNNESTLHVHHKEYFKGYEPWEYEINQLAVICEDCHEYQHSKKDALKWVTSYLKLDGPESRDECAILLAGFSGIEYEKFIDTTGILNTEYSKKIYDLGKKVGVDIL